MSRKPKNRKEPIVIGECSPELMFNALQGVYLKDSVCTTRIPMINENGHWATLVIHENNDKMTEDRSK